MGPWHEPMIEVAVREHVVNDSALPQLETMQMRYRTTRCVEESMEWYPKRYGSSHCTSLLPVVLYVVQRQPMYLQVIRRRSTTELSSDVAT